MRSCVHEITPLSRGQAGRRPRQGARLRRVARPLWAESPAQALGMKTGPENWISYGYGADLVQDRIGPRGLQDRAPQVAWKRL